MQPPKGFTLIELMVTVAVLAVLAAVATPAFNDFFQRYRLRGAADDVVSLLASARAEAVARNRDVAIVFTGSDAAWCVGATAGTDPAAGQAVSAIPTCSCTGDCRIGGRVMERAGGDYRGVAMTNVPANFVFDRRTGAVQPINANAVATFRSPNGAYSLSLQVSPLGRGRLCVPQGSPVMAGFPSC